MTDPNTFPDIAEFDLERQQLQRRRRIAEEMMAQRMPLAKMQGNYAILPGPGNTLAAGFDRMWGNYENNQIDQAELQNNLAARDASDATLSSIPTSGPERTQAQIRAATQMPSLRDAIKMQMLGDEANANRVERGEQAAADRVARAEEAEAARIEKGEQAAADRVAREDLRRIPAQSVHVSVSGGAGPASFGGAATQIGVDKKGNPVYRHTKSGKPFVYDENGQPVAHEGIIAPKPTTTQNKGTAPADDIAAANTLLEQAEPLIPNATGSGLGNVVDMGLALIGQSTTTGDNAAKLKSIQGALISKMPKMSGPQSDKDVMLYREMAGRIGDPNVPKSQKQAALETIREINARYTGLQNNKPNAPPPANDDPLGIRGRK